MPLAEDLDPGLSAEEEVRRAVPFFAARLGVPVPDAGLIAVSAADEPRVLDLHAAALVTVLQSRAVADRIASGRSIPERSARRCWRTRRITGGAGRRLRGCRADQAG